MKIKKGTLKKKADSASVNKIIDQATTTTASKVKEGKDAQQKQSEKIQAVTEEPTPSTSSFQANSQDSTESQSSKSADGLRRKSARKENSVDIVVTPVVRSEIVLKISDKLKNFLITDYVYILKEKLPSVPARVSTTYILQNYAEYKTAQSLNSLERSILMDFIEGITQYFDTTLGTQLLYAPERVRYNDITQQNPSIPICELYGAIHLARMFLKMGSLLSYSVIRGEHLESISNHLKNLMDFFTDNLKCYVQPTDYC